MAKIGQRHERKNTPPVIRTSKSLRPGRGTSVPPLPPPPTLRDLLLARTDGGLPWRLVGRMTLDLLAKSIEARAEGAILGWLFLERVHWTDEQASLDVEQSRLPLQPGGDPGRSPADPDFASPEVLNWEPSRWSEASDVYLAGLFVVGLLYGRISLTDFRAAEYMAAALRTAVPGLPLTIEPWLRRSLSPDPADRWRGVYEQREALARLMAQDETPAGVAIAQFALGGDTRAGRRKLRTGDDLRAETEVNEDRFAYGWSAGEDRGAPVAFAIVADGVSTANIGTGAEAADHACRTIEQAWRAGGLRDSEAALEVLTRCSDEIWAEAVARCEGEDDAAIEARLAEAQTMSTTAVLCLLWPDRAAIVSCGDSPAWLWSPREGLMRLNPEHTMRAALLRHMASNVADALPDIRDRAHAALTSCLGCPPPLPDVSRDVVALRPGDRLVLASDGLEAGLAKDKDPWAGERELERIIVSAASEGAGAKDLAYRLTLAADLDGAPDNVTVVVIAPRGLPSGS